METITNIEQSKKLAEILPLESADMCYKCVEDDPYDIVCKPYSEWKEEYKGLLVRGDANVIPCWSLAALLNVINDDYYTTLYHDGVAWNITAIHHDNVKDKHNTYANTQVDACYDLILKIKKSSI